MSLGLAGAPLAVLAGVLGVCFVWGQVRMQAGWAAAGPTNDFLTFYSAAGASDVYSPAALKAARPEGFSAIDTGVRPYLRTPFHAALFAPLRLLPYPTAYQVFQVLMVWCLVGFVLWWRPPTPLHTLLFAAISVPLFFSFIRGADLPLVLLALAACTLAVREGKSFRAGLCLSLAAILPAALLAVPLVILAQRRWKLGAGLALGLVAQAAVSFAWAGLDWPWRFAAAWVSAGPPPSALTPNLAGAAAWLGLEPVAAASAAIVLAGLVFAIAKRESFAVAIACALAAGALISPRAHLDDSILLLPAALALLAETSSWTLRFCAAVMLTPIGFVLQGRQEPIPALILLTLLALVLAAVLPTRDQAFRRRQLVQLRLS